VRLNNYQVLITIVATLLLLCALIRLLWLDVSLVRSYSSVPDLDVSISASGWWQGYDSAGTLRQFRPNGPEYLVVFVFHSQHAAADMSLWNETMQLLQSRLVPITFWGICDAGLDCNIHKDVASFVILSHLDPYQMRIVAKADATDEILIYNQVNGLVAHLKRAVDPYIMSHAIEQRVR